MSLSHTPTHQQTQDQPPPDPSIGRKREGERILRLEWGRIPSMDDKGGRELEGYKERWGDGEKQVADCVLCAERKEGKKRERLRE